MNFWRRLWSKKSPPRKLGDDDVLVISDIHLGEDILTEGPEQLSEYIRALNRELADFIAFHRQGAQERRLHLVINGDMFDFVKISLQPEQEAEKFERWSRQVGNHLSLAGLPNTPENVVWKLQRILEIHRPLFKEMARFILEGHRISIIEGNHDAEFFFPEVRNKLRDELVQLAQKIAAQNKGTPPPEGEELGERLQFHGWFLAEENRLHIEHGHQYDEYCSFEYNLAPLDKKEARTLATPFTHRLLPYFSEIMGDFSTHGIEKWTIQDHLRFAFKLGPKALFYMMRLFLTVGFELVGKAGFRRQQELRELAREHQTKLVALAQSTPYDYETLLRLDKLKARPAEFSVWRMMHGFYLDRLLLSAVSLMLIVVGLAMRGTFGWFLVLLTALVGGMGWHALARARKVDVPKMLRRSAAGIAALTASKLVVFGHSHHAELVELGKEPSAGGFSGPAYYLNSGSWVTREILRGEAGTGMTYVEICGMEASLKRWLGHKKEPVVLATTAEQPAPAADKPRQASTRAG